MKYTKKEIEQGYKRWIEAVRITPSEFMSDEEVRETDSDVLAKIDTEALIEYIAKV